MPIRLNLCLRSDGTPKSAFATKAEADAWIERQPVSEVVGLSSYPCREHGWHVGGNRYEATTPRREGVLVMATCPSCGISSRIDDGDEFVGDPSTQTFPEEEP